MEPYGTELNLRPIFAKLGHNLEEIRVRALQNIISKLEHSLVCDADLVQEKQLHVRLLEWFNLSSCPLQEQVLTLILRLSKHPSAASIYLEIGGVEFLTQLRLNVAATLHKLIDAILDNLFHLPSIQHGHYTQECVYRQQTTAGVDGGFEVLPREFLQPSERHPGSNSSSEQTAATNQYGSPAETQVGYFQGQRPDTAKPPAYTTQTVPAAAATCFKFSTFPWVGLTATDRHVLSSTDNSLRSHDVSLTVSACEFLSDVVFQDFPAEVFLQRPSIVKSLLSLLAVPITEQAKAAMYAVNTLRDLTACIEARIYFYQDPSMYTPKQDFSPPSSRNSSSASFLSHSLGSSDTRGSLLGRGNARPRGDGQDGDNTSPAGGSDSQVSQLADMMADGGEQLDMEDVQALQFIQWTTPQLCAFILEKLLPYLKSPDERFLLGGFQLIHQVATLLKESVSPSALWEDGSLPARELIEKFHDCLEMFREVMFYHHHSNLAASIPEIELGQHRVAFIGLSVCVLRLLSILLPQHMIKRALPESFVPALALMCEDETLSYSYPDIRQGALRILLELDAEAHGVFCHTQTICRSLRNTCSFLGEVQDSGEENFLELLSYAEDAVLSLSFHLNMEFVTSCIKLTSSIGKKTSPNPLALGQGRKITLQLLAHPLNPVKLQAYSTLLAIVKESLGVDHVVQPTSSSSQGAVFVIDQEFLYEVCCFGMNDENDRVRKMAEEVVLYLLQSQLLVPTARWQQLLESVTAILPVLEGFANLDTTLGKCILGLLETEPHVVETGTLPLLERFRGTLRLMFSSDARMRSEGLGKVAWFLAHEEEGMRKLPLFSQLNVENLTNLFIVDNPRDLVADDTTRSIFKVESLKKVYDIVLSETMDIAVKKSATDQLAVILQDCELHKAFLQKGGLETIVNMLKQGVKKQQDGSQQNPIQELLPSLVKILRCLVQYSYSLRHKLAHDPQIYYTVLRCGLLFHKDNSAKQEVADLMTFLLFDEMATLHISEGAESSRSCAFSLPAFIVKRYKLPFKPAVHDGKSLAATELGSSPNTLTSGSLAEMLRFTWNVAWHGDIDTTITYTERNKDQSQNLFNSDLCLSNKDKSILKLSYISQVMKQCLYDVQNATSHAMVTQPLLRLASYIVASGQYDVIQILRKLQWKEVLTRFFHVVPSSNSDEQLLVEIVHLMRLILKTPNGPPMEILDWLNDQLQNSQGALLGLLGRRDTGSDEVPEQTMLIRRQLNRQLVRFVQVFVGKFPYSLAERLTSACVHGDVTRNVLLRINRVDTAHFYNLPSLENTLLCLVHITARPGWSVGSAEVDSLQLCLQVLQTLLEVVSAFNMGRVAMSYMGRGVTRSATLCLRHLAFEMATQLHSQDWPRNWLFSRQATADSVGESGFHWLIPLWTYRDSEVRVAGVGIAVALTSTESGRITMTTQCQHIPGGIWGAAFSILLDQSECSLVREQAALLLVNLTSQPMPSGSVETGTNVWQGPVVRNEETQVCLVGLSALSALLHHTRFYQEMMSLLSNYYPQPAIHPVSVSSSSAQTTPMGSQVTLTTSGTGSHGATEISLLVDITTTPPQTTGLVDQSLQMRPSAMGQDGNPGSAGVLTAPAQQNVSGGGRQGIVGSAGVTPANPQHHLGSGHGLPNTSTPIPGDDVTSSTSGTSGPEYQSVATPCLVSAVCQLLRNLVSLATQESLVCIQNVNMHTVLLRILDVSLLEAYLSELRSTVYKKQFLLSFQDLLQVHQDIITFVTLCVSHDAKLHTQLLGDKTALRQLARLLSVAYPDEADTNALCESLWESVFTLFTTLLQVNSRPTLKELTPVYVKLWPTIAGRIVSVLQDKQQVESDLWLSCLHFLACLLAEEGRTRLAEAGETSDAAYTVSKRLDAPAKLEENDLFTASSGCLLCQALVKAYDVIALKPLEQVYVIKVAVNNALKSLLAVSVTAKRAALEVGLVETICEHIKQLNMKLKMDALELGKPLFTSKKENPLMSELTMTLDLLRNFMYQSEEVKVAAYECGLSNLIHKLWAWGQMDPSLMSTILVLLCTYTARCRQACSSLAFTNATGRQDKPEGKAQYCNNSLIHCLLKLLQRESTSDSSQLLRPGYAVLSTLALSPECRGILCKSNFLTGFSSFSPQKSKKSKVQRVIESLWLDLLVNLSFSTEGQNMILRINDGISLLLEYGENSTEHNRKCAVLILRNLCFHTSNKPKLLANEKLLPFLLGSLEGGSADVKMIGCSALMALTHNSEKAKASLKSFHVTRKLQDAYNHFLNLPESSWAERCATDLLSVLRLLKN